MIVAWLSELAEACHGKLYGEDRQVLAVSTDSRQLPPQSLFVALKGPRYDAHDFIDAAQAAGALALLVSQPVASSLPYILVEDTLQALGLLGQFNRQRSSVQLVALTGSAGKTTVKQLLASILAQQAPTLATQGNLNNEIGAPLTLLQIDAQHRYAVIELGANHIGEIAYTAGLAQPDLALVTNVMPAHLEGFGSIEGVLKAKSEIYQALKPGGQALINADSPYASDWQRLNAKRAITLFAIDAEAEVRATQIESQGLDGSRFRLQLGEQSYDASILLPGRHNVLNAVAAAAAAWRLGISASSIVAGLAVAANVGGRLKIQSAKHGIKLIDDSYNANPGSVRAAIDFLASLPGKRCLALGDMGELGEQAAQFHAEIGQYARQAGIENLYGCGPLMVHAVQAFGGQHFATRDALLAAVSEQLTEGTTLLVKGSRSARMDEVVNGLKA